MTIDKERAELERQIAELTQRAADLEMQAKESQRKIDEAVKQRETPEWETTDAESKGRLYVRDRRKFFQMFNEARARRGQRPFNIEGL